MRSAWELRLSGSRYVLAVTVIPFSQALILSLLWKRVISVGFFLLVGLFVLAQIVGSRLYPDGRVTLRLKILPAFANIALFLLAFVSLLSIERVVSAFGVEVGVLLWSLIWTLSVACGVVALVDLPDLLSRIKANRFVLVPLMILFVVIPVMSPLNKLLWQYAFLTPLSLIVDLSLNMLGYGVETILRSADFLVSHSTLKVKVAEACGGFQGYILFLVVYSTVLILDGPKLSTRTRLATFFSGLLFMSFLNAARIVALIGVGIEVGIARGPAAGRRIVKSLFHDNIGWIIYLAGMVLFFGVFYWLQKRREERGSGRHA